MRLFQSDGSLFYDEDSTGDGPLTLDLSSPSGYLAGLQSGNVDVWLEAVHPSSDFSFTVLYKDSQGDVFASDTIHMTLADWTFRNYDGLQLAAIDPIWEPPVLATLEQEVGAGIQGGIDEEPQSSTFKNQVVGLPDSANAQIQVASVDDPSDSYFDELNAVGGVLVSNDYGAVVSSDEILGADPDAPLTPAEKAAALNLDEWLPARATTLTIREGQVESVRFQRPVNRGPLERAIADLRGVAKALGLNAWDIDVQTMQWLRQGGAPEFVSRFAGQPQGLDTEIQLKKDGPDQNWSYTMTFRAAKAR